MQEPTESKEKKDWLDRFIEHGLLFFVAQIFGMAEIVSVDDPSVKGKLWNILWWVDMAVLICSLIATLVNLKKGPKAEQGMKKQLKAYWIRIKKYTDYLIFSAVALLVLRYAGPQILSLPDLAIENVEVLPKNLPTNINGNCLLTRPELRIVIKNKGDGPAGKFHFALIFSKIE